MTSESEEKVKNGNKVKNKDVTVDRNVTREAEQKGTIGRKSKKKVKEKTTGEKAKKTAEKKEAAKAKRLAEKAASKKGNAKTTGEVAPFDL